MLGSWQSEKQMHNHRQSKAHRKMVESLKEEFGDDVLAGIEAGEDLGDEDEAAGGGEWTGDLRWE